MGRCLCSHLDHCFQTYNLTYKTSERYRKTDMIISLSQDIFFQIHQHFGQGDKWLPDIIIKAQGPRSYKVNLSDNRIIRRHVDHVWSRIHDQQTSNQLTVMKHYDVIPIPISPNNVLPSPSLWCSTRISCPPTRLINFILFKLFLYFFHFLYFLWFCT